MDYEKEAESSAAGSGAREWYENWLATRPHRDLTTSHGVIGLLAAYAEHYTAQLREENASLLRRLTRASKDYLARVDDLTAERTRREAAERELKDARHEASTCDDVKLDQPLVGIIAEIQAHRERAERELKELRERAEMLAQSTDKLLPECPIVTHHKPDCPYCKIIKLRAALRGKGE